MEIGPGDEVILPAFTIISCIAQIIRCGATPVLIDSDPVTWNMDVSAISQRITPRTRAIIVVHTYGLPVDMDPVLLLCEKHGLAYSVASAPSFYNDTGAFQIIAGLDRKRSVKALALCAAEIRKIATTAVPKAEFERAREYMLGCLRLGLETARSHMSWIGNGTLRNQLITPTQAMENIKRVTREDVLAMASEIFKPENTTLTLVMPRADVAEPEAHLVAVMP